MEPIYEPAEVAAGARVQILKAFDAYAAAAGKLGLAVGRRSKTFVTQYNAGLIDVESWVRAAWPSISRGSLSNWLDRRDGGGAKALKGNYGLRAKTSKLKTVAGLEAVIRSEISTAPKITARQLMAKVRERGIETDFSIATLRRYMGASQGSP